MSFSHKTGSAETEQLNSYMNITIIQNFIKMTHERITFFNQYVFLFGPPQKIVNEKAALFSTKNK